MTNPLIAGGYAASAFCNPQSV